MGRKVYEQFTCNCGIVCQMIPHETSGKLAPLTLNTNVGGNIEVLDDGAGWVRYRIVPKAEREADPLRPRHLNHFSNCPNREQFGGRSRPS